MWYISVSDPSRMTAVMSYVTEEGIGRSNPKRFKTKKEAVAYLEEKYSSDGYADPIHGEQPKLTFTVQKVVKYKTA